MLTEEDLLRLLGSEKSRASPNESAVVLVLKHDMEPNIWRRKKNKKNNNNRMKTHAEKEKHTTAFAFIDGIND